MIDQHSSAPESHHAQSAFEHEALKVRGGGLQFQAFGAVDSVGFLRLPVRIVHALHVLPQLIFPLRDAKDSNKSKNSTEIYSIYFPVSYLTAHYLELFAAC